jgi:hypothetical protein
MHTSWAQKSGEKIDGHWRRVLGLHLQDGAYTWSGYPNGNFGAMTLYRAPSGKQLTDVDRVCATWTCIGVDPGNIPADEFRFTTIEGFANTRVGLPFELANDKAGTAAIDLLLSNLFHALAMEETANISKPVTFDLRAVEVYRRTLNLPRFREFLQSSPDPLLRDARIDGKLTFIGADIVARGLELTIDAGNDPRLAAQLTQAIARLGHDHPSGVRLSHLWRQTYVVHFPEFVVLATQLRHQPAPNPRLAKETEIASRQAQFKSSTSNAPMPGAPMPGTDLKTLR